MPTPQENKLENVGNFQSHIGTTVLGTVTGEVALSARSNESKYHISSDFHGWTFSFSVSWNSMEPKKSSTLYTFLHSY